jgi:membrane protein implicated in regulation of membrane protease activity
MINPLRSEAEAYRFLLLTVGYFAAIAIAALVIGTWAGVIVFLVLTGAGALYVLRASRSEPPRQTVPSRRGRENERRILVIANETVGGGRLRDEISTRSEGYDEHVLVVTPALNSHIRHWASDEDNARLEAQKRLDASLARLRAGGIDARGEVGDAEPLQAMEDALRLFGADEIIISTHPEGRSHWLEKNVVESARERFAVPITHVVVDLQAEREEVREPGSTSAS